MNLWRRTAPEYQAEPPCVVPAGRPEIDCSFVPRARETSPPPVSRPWLHALLFILTLISMATAGAMQQGVNPLARFGALVHLVEGIPFAATLLCILSVHEFGHYFAARRWGVKATLPYFLPLPFVSFLGTLGAVIKIRSPIPHRRALLDLGAAGPLAGFAVALIACIVGLTQSRIVESDYFNAPPIRLGSPLLFSALAAAIFPGVSAEQMVLLSPVAFAGWVGLFITAFNLFPVGQLDGGHIAYALFGPWHRRISRAFFALLLALGLYGLLSLVWIWPQSWPSGWPGWLVLVFFLALFGKNHPAPCDTFAGLDPRRRCVGYLCLVVFALCFSPVPFSY
jgi:membrane-associated protease RseP (regulator of RpoE activity)